MRLRFQKLQIFAAVEFLHLLSGGLLAFMALHGILQAIAHDQLFRELQSPGFHRMVSAKMVLLNPSVVVERHIVGSWRLHTDIQRIPRNDLRNCGRWRRGGLTGGVGYEGGLLGGDWGWKTAVLLNDCACHDDLERMRQM